MAPRIKICCIRSIEEAALAVRLGASAVGLVSAMPSGPGVIDDALIAEIAATVPPGIATFLLTALTDAEAIVEQQRRCRTNTVQLVDAVEISAYATLRRALPGIAIVQVIHVTGVESLAEARALAPHVDALLLDSGNPKLAVKELGGTGRVHDWSISRRIVAAAGKPVYLAGGLTPENVGYAVAQVGPYGLDLCNGVRGNGALHAGKLEHFMRAAGASI